MLPASAITMPALKVASPAALPSIVKKVVSAPPSVPLRMISLSLAAASIVILPELVVIRTAASPAVKSSYAVDMPSWKYVLNVAALVTFIVPPSL